MKKIILFIVLATSSMIYSQAPSNGLLAYYSFNGNANSHNGLFNMTNLHTTGTSVSYGPGGNGTGYAATFFNTGLKNTTIAPEITSEFTVAYWGSKNPITESDYATRFELFASAFHRKNTGAGYLYAASSSNGVFSIGNLTNGTAGGTTGGWFHYAMCFKTVGNTKILEFYVDGIQNNSITINNTNDIYKYNQVFSIGGGTNADGTPNGLKYFDGSIDECYVYNRALTPTEINTIKNTPENLIAPNSPPVITNVSSASSGTSTTNVIYTLNANGSNTTSIIRYGTSASNLSQQVAGSSTSGFLSANASTQLTNLTPATTYYYQIEATNSNGITTSIVQSFIQTDPSVIAEYNFNNTYNNIYGNAPFASDGSFTLFENDRNNVSLGALRINATTSAAVIPNLPIGNSPRSVSIWVKKPTAAADAHVFRYGTLTVNSTNLVYGLAIQGNNLVNFGYNNDLTAVGYGTTGQAWIHVVTTFDGTTAKIYHNGVERASGNKSAWNTQNTNFFLGNQHDITVDDLKIYNRVLTPTEISNLYNFNSILSTEGFNQNKLKATISPNPASEDFTIHIDSNIKFVEIYSLQGQKVLTSESRNINVSNLSKGIYLVHIEDENNNRTTQNLIVK
jgi:Concanavalin A-like lectin/glucanases superfamily/Secretion system C-terminal sorting domain/Purple acid Phosphatase, N-terminal domain